MQPKYQIAGTTHLVTPLRQDADVLIEVDGHAHRTRLHWRDAHEFELSVDGIARTVYIAQDDNRLFLHLDGRAWQLRAIDEFGDRAANAVNADTMALAPMPGVVVEVYAAIGQHVERGDNLLLIESMKLQSEIRATCAGVVSRIAVSAGSSFERNAVLVEIDADPAVAGE